MPQIPPDREKPLEVPWREVEHQGDERAAIDHPTFTVGSASDGWTHDRKITSAERERWKKEDAERDKRRIPIGFRTLEDRPPPMPE